jgi:two-component system sensor histidine kinase KdpD
MPERARSSGEQLLAKLQADQRARLRIYVGAAPGVGKTYSMLQDAHALRREGVDVVVGFVETYGRAETEAQIGDLEIVPRRRIEYRGVVLEEMDLDAILRRRPQLCVVDELAHTNVPGSAHEKRYQDVGAILDAGIGVLTAVNIQHLETLNDAVGRVTGVRVRETVPDTFLDRADEVVNVDVTVQELQSRLRQGKVYKPEKVEQALSNFFRETNLSTLRELALRAVADEVGDKGRVTPAARGAGAGTHPGARDGLYELERRGTSRDSHRLTHRRPAGRALVCGLRRNASRGARQDHTRPIETRCIATSCWPKALAQRWSGSKPIARRTA